MTQAAVLQFLPSALIDRRITLKLIISAEMSLFQGDPDNANRPRLFSDGRAYVTPQGLRRKVRDVASMKGHNIWVSRGADLSAGVLASAGAVGFDIGDEEATQPPLDGDVDIQRTEATAPKAPKKTNENKTKKDANAAKGVKLRQKGHLLTEEQKFEVIRKLGEYYADVRMFGGVLTSLNKGVVAPIWVGFGKTIDPVEVIEITVGRVAVANANELKSKDRTMGSMAVCRFGVMTFDMSITPKAAALTGLTWGDYEMFLETLTQMWDNTKSTTRGRIVNERLVSFIHGSPLGNIQDARLYDALQAKWVTKTEGDLYPRSMLDYEITLDKSRIPKEVDVVEIAV